MGQNRRPQVYKGEDPATILIYGKKVPVKFAQILGNNSTGYADQKSQWAQTCKNYIHILCVLMRIYAWRTVG